MGLGGARGARGDTGLPLCLEFGFVQEIRTTAVAGGSMAKLPSAFVLQPSFPTSARHGLGRRAIDAELGTGGCVEACPAGFAVGIDVGTSGVGVREDRPLHRVSGVRCPPLRGDDEEARSAGGGAGGAAGGGA